MALCASLGLLRYAAEVDGREWPISKAVRISLRFFRNITFLIAALAAAGAVEAHSAGPAGRRKLELSCPPGIARDDRSPQGSDVHFDAPVPTGDANRTNVQVSRLGQCLCDRRDGGSMHCNDADSAQASCAFGVTVRASRTIAKTRFMAFGDSITDGAVSLAPLIMLGPPDTYPFKLEQMLRERYPSQSVIVVNEGRGGEDTRGGARRLPAVLDAEKPEVLLLLEGINNRRLPRPGTAYVHESRTQNLELM